jgi:hypothetical protein
MAEVIEGVRNEVPSKGKVNAALTTGIIGTALSGIMALGALGIGSGIFGGKPQSCALPHGELYNERKETADYIELTKQYYTGQFETQSKIDKNFFDTYKMNVDTSFALYKGQRDTKDELVAKIDKLERQVDVMAAVRPYQDALINAKIDNVAMVGDFNLAKRTCRMIQGELVLPSTPTVTGYASYSPCNPQPAQAGA